LVLVREVSWNAFLGVTGDLPNNTNKKLTLTQVWTAVRITLANIAVKVVRRCFVLFRVGSRIVFSGHRSIHEFTRTLHERNEKALGPNATRPAL